MSPKTNNFTEEIKGVESAKPSREKSKDFNIFIANSLYPDAEQIFTAKFKSLEEIKDNCIVVVDTNALLVPYKVDKESLEQIKKTYLALSEKGQLIIPGQAAREFAKNRAIKVGEVFEQLERKRDSINKLQIGKYPLLASIEKYNEILELEQKINDLVKDYRKSLSEILEKIRGWTWNDPVSVLYGEIFEGIVLDIAINEGEMKKELTSMQIHKIPPGYKDASKDDAGIGDYLIWKTILHLGNEYKKDILFVSGEEKPDWWHRSNGKALYPRYELVDEFRRYSDGKTFHIAAFSDFLDLYGASTQVVEEVRSKEHLAVPLNREGYGADIKSSSLEFFAVNAVCVWLTTRNRSLEVTSSEKSSLLFVDENGYLTEVEVVFVSEMPSLFDRLENLSGFLKGSKDASKDELITEPMIVLVASTERLAHAIYQRINKIRKFLRVMFYWILVI